MNCIRPNDLQDCLALMASERFTPIAGGTDLLVAVNERKFNFENLLDISGLTELNFIQETPSHLHIGALTTFADLENKFESDHPFCHALYEAAYMMGSPQIRNRSTLGGNLVTGSSAADGTIALFALGAAVELRNLTRSRTLPLTDFFKGYKQTAIQPDEILTKIIIPVTKGFSRFMKVGKRNALAIAIASLSIYYEKDDFSSLSQINIAAGSIAATPIRLKQTEEALRGQKITPERIQIALETVNNEIFPIDDQRATASYRRMVTGNMLKQLLHEMQ